MSSKNKKIGPFKHYTTLRSFLSLEDPGLESVQKGCMEFHLSRIDKANDMEEMSFLMDKIKEQSNNKKELEEKIKRFFQKNGLPTYMSFSYPNGSTISNDIPMWNMYSRHRGSPGICLNFRFDEEFYNNHLYKCVYLNNEQLKDKAETFDTSIMLEEMIDRIIGESVKTKSSKWRYEKEYRIIQFCNDFYHYAGAYDYVEYDKFLIPIKYLTRIYISPFENETITRKVLERIRNELKEKVQNKECIKFQINKSKLKIR